MEDTRDEINKRKRENWFDVWFVIEALSVEKDTVEKSLHTHIEKLKRAKDAFVYETNFGETQEVNNPLKGVEKGYSQIVEVKLFVKNLSTLINLVMLYGPSSIEIIGPDKKEINIEEVQNIANAIAGVMHQFASAGIGGLIITPEK